MSAKNMKKANREEGEMRSHYDFSGGIRGKYAAEYAKGTNIAVIDPDLAKVFPTSQAVNEALRTLTRVAGKSVRSPRPKKRRT